MDLNELKLNLFRRLFLCEDQESFHGVMEDLKQLLFFEDYGLARVFLTEKESELLSFEIIEWFRGTPGFEQCYEDKDLFESDPNFQQFLKDPTRYLCQPKPWKTAIEEYRRIKPAKIESFLSQQKRYSLEESGFSWFIQVNPIQYFCLSFQGAYPKSNKTIESILGSMAPAIANVCDKIRIGRTAWLSKREFEIYRVLKTSMRSREIARSFGVSVSTVEKYKAIILGKLGHDRFELPFEKY